MDAESAGRRQAIVDAQLARLRDKRTAGEAREVLSALFPSGLTFRIVEGVRRIEGAACMPTVHGTGGGIRRSAATRARDDMRSQASTGLVMAAAQVAAAKV
jgi:hypothetical protein